MSMMVIMYLTYLLITVTVTVWVGSTLYKNGRHFLVDIFEKNTELADAVNHLLIVGFYLINLGYVSVSLNHNGEVLALQEGIEVLSGKVGFILIVLGIMHFFNLLVLSRFRGSAKRKQLHAQSLSGLYTDTNPA
ncbi:MAG: hypothetical protein KTR14_06065 [Vampirovibrio sp.]|nr:hypothetical protein [Vampirovibrio sp.]